jgi:hypothetical protein
MWCRPYAFLSGACVIVFLLGCVTPVKAQPSMEDRITHVLVEHYREQRERGDQNHAVGAALRQRLDQVAIEQMPARDALKQITDRIGVDLMVNWDRLRYDAPGVDPDYPVTVRLRNVTAQQALVLILNQVAPDRSIMLHVSPWFVQVTSRSQANTQSVVRVYEVADMMHHVPDFTDAPAMDLSQISSDTEGGGADLFGDADRDSRNRSALSEQQRAERLIRTITSTIEPDIWYVNGGDAGRISYFRGNLVIRAPQYVHDQIGLPSAPASPGQIVGAGMAFNPQVDVANSGTVVEGTATASRDLRYVTFSGGMTSAEVESVQTFPVVRDQSTGPNAGNQPGASSQSYGRSSSFRPYAPAPSYRSGGYRSSTGYTPRAIHRGSYTVGIDRSQSRRR